MKAASLRRLMNLWPPFAFSGIHVTHWSDDFRYVRVELRQRWYNRNYVRTHFGGSLFAMTDPFWMILLLRNLGSAYRVWDQTGEITFIKPGRGTVVAEFRLDPATVEAVRTATADGQKYLHWFETDVRDSAGDIVARVRKQVYARRKREPVDAA